MTQQDIERIQRQLSIWLPHAYVALMTAADAQHGEFYHRDLFNDPAFVVKRTALVREIMASCNVPFKSTFFVVTEVNGGDQLLMDCDSPETAKDDLFIWDHEINEVTPCGTLSQFASA